MPLMIKTIKFIIKSGFIVASFFTVSHLCKKATGGFSELSIIGALEQGHSDLPSHLKHLQYQKFYYLGKGAQAFAFLSEDKTTVVKFMRFDHLKPKALIRSLSFISHPYIKERLSKSQRELFELLRSFDFAQQYLNEETQVLHFQKKELKTPLEIYDKIGCRHFIKNAPFIVQKYVPSLETQIKMLDEDSAISIIHQLAHLSKKRMDAGILDKDPNLLTNFGYKDGKLVEFDIGRFYPSEKYLKPSVRKEEFEKICSILWPYFPKLKDYFESQSFEL